MTSSSTFAQRVLIIGTGLIGTSIAMSLQAQGRTVFLADSNEEALATAIAKSGAHTFSPDQHVDLVIVATPPSTVAQVLRQAAKDHPDAVLTDVASVKSSILAALADEPSTVFSRIVGGHPMAGREVSGAQSAQSNLFVDRPWVLTRNEHTSEQAFAVVRQLAVDLGAVPFERTAAEHDQAVALISHTPQLLASILASRLVDAPQSHVDLAGQGIRDTVRLASSDATLWADILASNADEVADQLAGISRRIDEVVQALTAGDDAAVSTVLGLGNAGVQKLPGKHGTGSRQDALVVVRLEDKPGELARLLAATANANVNIEDVRIDHSLGRMTGLVELTVGRDAQQSLTETLGEHGFIVIA